MHPPPHITHSTPQLHSTKKLQLHAPQYTGRLNYLLTLKLNTFRLTKVNKINCKPLIINKLQHTNTNSRLQQKTAGLTKLTCNNINPTTSPIMKKHINHKTLIINVIPKTGNH